MKDLNERNLNWMVFLSGKSFSAQQRETVQYPFLTFA